MGETIESLRQERDKAEAALARELAAREAAEKALDVSGYVARTDTLLARAQAAEKENTSLSASVKRLSLLAVEKGYGVWRCVKCDTRYTTAPGPAWVCGNSVLTEKGPTPCHGRLEPFVPEASENTANRKPEPTP